MYHDGVHLSNTLFSVHALLGDGYFGGLIRVHTWPLFPVIYHIALYRKKEDM